MQALSSCETLATVNKPGWIYEGRMNQIKRPRFAAPPAPATPREAQLEGAARTLVSAVHEYAQHLLARIEASDATVLYDANDIGRCLRSYDGVAAEPSRWYRALGLLPPLVRHHPLVARALSLSVGALSVSGVPRDDAAIGAMAMFVLPGLLHMQELVSPLRPEMFHFGYEALTFRASRILAAAEGEGDYVDPDLAMDATRVLAHRNLMQVA
jgi:hypothetical protein